jgi:hypothetical protein
LCHEENVEDFEHQWNLLVARFELVTDKHIEDFGQFPTLEVHFWLAQWHLSFHSLCTHS